MPIRSFGVAVAALAASVTLVLVAPLSASAHVTVTPGEAQPGGYATLTVNVPGESDSASTVRVVVELPTDHPLLSVRWVPVAGWTAATTTEKLAKPVRSGDDTITEAVTRITWTATDGGAPPGSTVLFPISVGPIPDTPVLLFPTHQYYGDGTVADWVDAAESAAHPAPRLTVRAATATATVAAESDVVARLIGFAGLLIGAVGVVVAALALRRSRTP